MKHDQIWKMVIWTFFADFMELFLPDAARRLDFSRITPLNNEMFTALIDGERREPDILAEVYTRSGEPEIILVHIEVQAARNRDVPYRMWEYYSLLRLRTKKPVLPIVLYLVRGTGGIVQEKYTESLFGIDIQTFSYTAVGLPDLSADEYLEKENILAPALSALMRGEKGTRVIRKLKAYQRMAGASMDDTRRTILMHVIDSYITLSPAEEEEMSRKLEDRGNLEVHEMLSTYEVRGMKKGLEQGIEQGIERGKLEGKLEGIVAGKRDALFILLSHKFGKISYKVMDGIAKINSLEELDALIARAIDAVSLEDLGI